MNFASQEDKDAFLYRLGEARRILKQPDNTALLCAMLDLVLATPSPATSTGPTRVQCPITWCWYLLGMYIRDDDPKDQSLCVVEHKAIKSLCQGLVQQCCYTSRPSWELESFMKVPQNVQIFVN